MLLTLGVKYNYGMQPGTQASPDLSTPPRSVGGSSFQTSRWLTPAPWGRERAWRQFIDRFRAPLQQAAIAITSSADQGRELADSLYAELYGLNDGRSPLSYYSGSGSLKGFLRATLAQRHVDRHRRLGRETSLTDEDPPAPPVLATPQSKVLERLSQALAATLAAVPAEDRFLLTSWFLDRRSMLNISRVLAVHEATVSRKIA